MKFYIVDVFGREKYSGNQLAVVVLDKTLPKDKMQQIAREFNFSETTFISMHESDTLGYKVNIFTPKNEVPFAGHPTLGTAFVIKNEILKSDVEQIILNLGVGAIPVTFDKDGLLWMKQVEPSFGAIHKANEIAPMINVSPEEIDELHPIQSVSTGVEFMIIPLKRLDVIKSASSNMIEYNNYFKDKNPVPLFLFCPETYESVNNINCRMFADLFGIPEDPATGSANGCLAGYLVKNRCYNSDSVDVKVEQGFEIDRKSILHLQSSIKEDGKIDIRVGGRVFSIAEGNLI